MLTMTARVVPAALLSVLTLHAPAHAQVSDEVLDAIHARGTIMGHLSEATLPGCPADDADARGVFEAFAARPLNLHVRSELLFLWEDVVTDCDFEAIGEWYVEMVEDAMAEGGYLPYPVPSTLPATLSEEQEDRLWALVTDPDLREESRAIIAMSLTVRETDDERRAVLKRRYRGPNIPSEWIGIETAYLLRALGTDFLPDVDEMFRSLPDASAAAVLHPLRVRVEEGLVPQDHPALRSIRENIMERPNFIWYRQSFGLPLPGTETFHPLSISQDASISAAEPDQVRGLERELVLRGDGSASVVLAVTADAWDPVEGVIGGATLELYADVVEGDWGPEGVTIAAYRLLESWSEATVTWRCPTSLPNGDPCADRPWVLEGGNGSARSTEPAGFLTEVPENGWVRIDVLRGIDELYRGRAPNAGWILVASGGTASDVLRLRSSEMYGGAPQLMIRIEN